MVYWTILKLGPKIHSPINNPWLNSILWFTLPKSVSFNNMLVQPPILVLENLAVMGSTMAL